MRELARPWAESAKPSQWRRRAAPVLGRGGAGAQATNGSADPQPAATRQRHAA